MNKAIFLDRDGVLNKIILQEGKPCSPSSLDELYIPTEVAPALKKLKKAGFLLLGVTNQPNVSRGLTTYEVVDAIHQTLLTKLPLDQIFVCYHDDQDHCFCRKPQPGLLIQAAQSYSIDMQKSFLIGDRWRDIEAGQNAGCTTIWLNLGYENHAFKQEASYKTNSFKDAANWILRNTNEA